MLLFAGNAYAEKAVVITLWDASVTWRGAWSADTKYSEGDMVEYDGSSYMALVGHTSTLSNYPPEPSIWDLAVASGANGMDGADSTTPGPQGDPGINGTDGDSAYQVWLSAGNTGTEQDFLDSIVGPQGDVGPAGPAGPAGPQGAPWVIDSSLRLAMCQSFLNAGAVIPDGFCPYKTVFAIRGLTGDTDGLIGADLRCQNASDSVAGAFPGTYKAWLSDGVDSPSSRFTHSTEPYLRTDGQIIAMNWADLTDGTLGVPIVPSNNGDSAVWSNTRVDGTVISTNAVDSCYFWTAAPQGSNATLTGLAGNSQSKSNSWTDGGGVAECGGWGPGKGGLYCFQQ